MKSDMEIDELISHLYTTRLSQELAEWVLEEVLQPAVNSADMATVGQSLWFVADLINVQLNATLAHRGIDEEFAQTELMIAGTSPSPRSAPSRTADSGASLGNTNNTTQHNTTQHNTTQHNTTQHNTTHLQLPRRS